MCADRRIQYMDTKKVVLIVEDEEINREILKCILIDDYDVLEVDNGKVALDILRNRDDISAIILDIIMPVMNGMEFLKVYHNDEHLTAIPLIVSTSDDDDETECECLKYDAWDFIKKPYNRDIIKFRIRNAIERSNLSLYKELKYREEYDSLTGIYGRRRFFQETRAVIRDNPDKKYLFIRFDIHKFQLVNQFFGVEKGDMLIKHASKVLKNNLINEEQTYSFGRINADIFCCCIEEIPEEELAKCFQKIRADLNEFDIEFDLLPVYGIYRIVDCNESIDTVYDGANLAAKKCKGNYIRNYEYYDESMRKQLVEEQIIVNEMAQALEEEQFVLYVQPKYEIRHEELAGGEILVRWLHPIRGMISPGMFVPIFERNGFISKLDYYVLEHTCMMIDRWIKEKKKIFPVSVNISRVSLYNPKLPEQIIKLVSRYNIPPEYIQFELTESAYTSNPELIKKAMKELQNHGFKILMDDFGSGYSSLNVLKDIAVDILKLDMRFMVDGTSDKRGENILASVVRMAKWLEMPVIAEGVEQKQQVEFLRSVGCEYVQGFYYAKPMPVDEYEKKVADDSNTFIPTLENHNSLIDKNGYVNTDSILNILFSDLVQAIAIYEYDGNDIYLIRANNEYYDIFGYENIDNKNSIQTMFEGEYRKKLEEEFKKVNETKKMSVFQLKRKVFGKDVWMSVSLKYIDSVEDKGLLCGSIIDITSQKQVDFELEKYRNAVLCAKKQKVTILIVDDLELSRAILKGIFKDDFIILEAQNGKQAIDVIENNEGIDLILLDMDMPVMDGKTFLTTRQDDPKLKSIPVIVITADDNVKAQADTINLDVEDYIVKPFVSEVVLKRVNHVLDSKKMVGRMLDEYRLDNATAVKNFQKDIKNINNYNEEITQLRNDNK